MKIARTAFTAFAALIALNLTPARALEVNKVHQAHSNADFAIRLYNGRRYAEAARQLSENIKSEYGSGIASNYYYLGNCYYNLNRRPQAVQMYKMVMGRFPDSKEAKSARSMLVRLSPESLTEIKRPTKAPSSPPNHASQTRPTNRSSSQKRDIRTLTMADLQKMFGGTSGTKQDISHLPNENRFFFNTGSSGHMIVDIYLNGRKMQAWFDTGANAHFGINHLRAAGINDIPRGKPNTYTSGWARKKIPAWQVNMKLRIGNMERVVPVTIEQNMKLPPLVGQGFIDGYEYEVQNNGSHRFVSMRKKSSGGGSIYQNNSVSDLYDVPCITRQMREFVVMKANGKNILVLLDTGSDNTIIAASMAKKLNINIPANAQTIVGSGVGGKVKYKIVPVDIKLGPIYARNFPVHIGPTGGLSAVGQDLLSKHRFKIDRKKSLLRFFH